MLMKKLFFAFVIAFVFSLFLGGEIDSNTKFSSPEFSDQAIVENVLDYVSPDYVEQLQNNILHHDTG